MQTQQGHPATPRGALQLGQRVRPPYPQGPGTSLSREAAPGKDAVLAKGNSQRGLGLEPGEERASDGRTLNPPSPSELPPSLRSCTLSGRVGSPPLTQPNVQPLLLGINVTT